MYPGFDPDETDNESAQIEDDLSEKNGWFHGWTQMGEKDPQSDNYLVTLYGVIEREDGILETFPYNYFRFVDQPQ